MSQFVEGWTTIAVVRAAARRQCWLVLVLFALSGSLAAQTVTQVAPTNVDAGQSLSYVITVSNGTGSAIASGIEVIDTLPSQVTYTSFSGSGWTCSEAVGVVTCALGNSLADGASSSVTLQGTASAPATDTSVTNAVSLEVSGSAVDSDSANTTIRAVASLSLDKSIVNGASRVDALTVRGGDPVTFAVSVSNSGPSPANTLQVRDTLPAGFVYNSASGTNWSCSAVGSDVTCNYAPDLASGATASELQITTTSPIVSADRNNTATAQSIGDDTAFPFSSDTVTVTLFREADLRVSKSVAASPVLSGELISYSYTVTNNGPASATGLTLTDVFDFTNMPGTPTVTAGAANWSCSWSTLPAPGQSQLDCTAASALPASGSNASSFTVAVTAPTVNSSTTINNQATVTATESLPTPANNQSALVSVVVEPAADLSIAARTSPAAPQDAESNFSYTVNINNAGPSTASNLVLNDRVPAGALLNSVSGAGWVCSINQVSGSYRCVRSALGASTSASLTVSTQLPRNPPTVGTASGTISSGSATVVSATADPVASNNQDAPFNVTVAADWNLAISKTAIPQVVVPGQSFQYEIAIDNFGPSDLTDSIRALLSDDFNSNLRGGLDACGVGANDPCWQCDSALRPTQISALDTGTGAGLTGISGARQIAISPDRRFVFAAGRFDSAIAVMSRSTNRNTSFGELTYTSFNTDATAPRALTVHPSGLWLLSADKGASGSLWVQSINPATGALGTATEALTGLNESADLTFNADGDVLYVAESGADSIRILAFDDGSGAVSSIGQTDRDDVSLNQVLLGGVSRVALSADGAYLYAAGTSDNAIVGFSVNATTGALTPLSSASIVPLVGGQPIPFSALATGIAGDELYAGGGSRVLVFSVNAGGALGGFVATSATALPARLLDGISDLVASPDGNSVYVSATTDAAVSVFSRDGVGDLVFERSEALPDSVFANGLVVDSAGETIHIVASSQDVTGLTAPDRSLVITYGVSDSAACDGLRLGETDSGDIVDRAISLPAGQRLTIIVDAELETGLSNTQLDNIATLEDPDGTIIQDNALIDIRNATEVVVTKSAPGERPIPGTEFAYTIEIDNRGPRGLTDLKVTSIPPTFGGFNVPGFVVNSFEWQCVAEGNACCSTGASVEQCGQIQPTALVQGTLDSHGVDMPSDSRLVFTLRGTLHPSSTPDSTLTSDVELTMPSGVDAFDQDDLDDSLSVDMDGQSDLWLVKDSGPVTDQNGTPSIRYEIKVGNFGPSAAAGLSVVDDFDPLLYDVANATWSCQITNAGDALSQSCCSYATNACQATDLIGQTGTIDQDMALSVGAEAIFTLDIPVADPGLALVENEAEIQPPALVTDPDPSNNRDRALVRLLTEADLDLTKQLLSTAVIPGEEVRFEVRLQSDGPDDVPVIVQDLLPPFLENVTWTCDATTPTPGDLSYVNDLGQGAELVDPVAVVTSADGRHVYMLGAGGVFAAGDEPSPASLVAYERNIVPGPNFGELMPIDLEVDGVNDEDDAGLAVEFLADARGMTISPDQRHLYVASGSPGAIVVFRRDSLAGSPQFGQLSFVEARPNGSDQPGDLVTPVSGVGGATAVAVSRDGEHVYVAAREEHAVATFRRDPATGVLAFQGKISAPALLAQGPFALWGALSVDIPPEDDFVYVTGRGPVDSFSGPNWSTTDTRSAVGDRSYFVPNTAGIALKWLELERPLQIADASDLRLSFQHIFSLDWATSCFDAGVLEVSTDGGENWVDVLTAGGQFIGPGGYNDNQNGAEQNPLAGRAGWCRNSPNWSSGGFNDVLVDLSAVVADGESLLIRFGLGEGVALGNPGWWIDDIRVFNDADPSSPLLVDTAAGGGLGATITVLSRNDDDTAFGFGDLAYSTHIPLTTTVDVATMDDGGESYYIGSAAEEQITLYPRNPTTGGLATPQSYTLSDSLEPPISAESLQGLAAMTVTPDGEHLLASGAAVDRLVVFRRTPFAGTLMPMQELELGRPADQPVNGGIEGVRSIAVTSDGLQVFTAASVGELGVFARRAPDPTFGFLEAVVDGEPDGFGLGDIASGLLGARALATTADYVFVASYGQIASPQSGALVILERDQSSTEPGEHLRFVEANNNNQAGITGLDGAIDVTVIENPPFNDIYVAAERSNAVTHLRQDIASGNVVSSQSYANGTMQGSIEISGMSGASAVTSSSGLGEQIYVAGRFDHAVAIFNRDAVTGALTFAGEARNGVDGVVGMLGANALVMSTDSQQLYVAARESDSVVVLDRVGDTLVHRQTFFDGTEGAVLTSPTGIAVSQEGSSEHVLVTSLDADAVTVLKRITDPTQPDLRGNVRFQQSLVDGFDGVDGLRGPRGIVVDPSNDRVYVASDDDDALVIFNRNTSPGSALFGSLAPLEIRRLGVGGVIGLDRPYGLAVASGPRTNIYAASLGGQSVTAFVRRSGSSCPAAGSGNLSEPVFIAAGGTVRFTITGTVNPGALGDGMGNLVNTATLVQIPDEPINNTGNDSASSLPAPVTPNSTLVVEKSNDQLSIVAGETTNYRIVVSNSGPSHARAVSIQDLLSLNPQFDESTALWSCTAVGTGLLDRLETFSREATDQPGLFGSAGVAWTPAPDPLLTERVYTTGVLGDAIAVFSIDPITRALVPEPGLGLEEGGTDAAGHPISSLRGARALAAAFNGSQLYVVSQIDNSISIINVDTDDSSPTFGQLTLDPNQVIDSSDQGMQAFDQPTDIVISADGSTVYVAAANSNAIYVFDRLPTTGALVPQPTQIVQTDVAANVLLDGVSDLLIGPEGNHLYAAGTNSASVVMFERNVDGTLTHQQTRSSPATASLGGVNALQFGPEGARLYAVARDDEAIVVFDRDNDNASGQFGRLTGVAQRIDRSTVLDLVSPREILISPDGGSAYVSAFGRNALLVFNRDRETGALEFLTRYLDSSNDIGLTGVSGLALSPSGEELAVGALLDDSVTRFELSGFSRCLDPINGNGIDSGTGDVDVVADIAAGGEVIIDLAVQAAANAEGESCPLPLDPSLDCLVNSTSVSLTQNSIQTDYSDSDASFLQRAANLVISKSDGLAEFRGLSQAAAIDGTEQLGAHLYVAAPGESAIGVYAIEDVIGSPTGDYPLRFVEVLVSGENGVSQLNGISDVLVSPDGRHVYAASALDSSIVAFDREPVTGRLSALAIYRNNNNGVSGLSGPRAMTMDLDGRHLYAAGASANSVVVFARQNDPGEPGFGELTWQSAAQNGSDGVQDLLTPVDLELSPDGRHLYVAAQNSDAVVTLRREADDAEADFGDLTWIQSRRNLVGDVVGLLEVSRVLVSPDGEFVYAAGTGNNAIVVFDRVSGAAETQFGRLSFVDAAVDGDSGFQGLADVSDLALVGAGGALMAASSPSNDSVALLNRDVATGLLSFSDLIVEGDVQNPPMGGPLIVDGLVGANALFTLPGQSRLYAGSTEPGALVAVDEVAGQMEFAGSVIQGDGGAVPGDPVQYIIQVRNEGPSKVVDARVTDIFPPEFESVSWECSFGSSESSCPSGPVTGNIDSLVDIDAGDVLTFIATALLRSDASGLVVNRAGVTMPAGVIDLDPASSEAIDDDTIVRSRSDLEVTFEGLAGSLVAGADVNYQIRVRNLGPSNASGARVEHRLPEALGRTSWVCEANREPGTLDQQVSPTAVFELTRASAISLDGRHVYVTGDAPMLAGSGSVPALAIYQRNTLTGELQLARIIRNFDNEPDPAGDRTVDGLAGARALALSNDDRFLYVLGYGDDAIAVFERDSSTGDLVFLQVLRDNIGVVDGLGGPSALVFSDSQEQIYVAGELDNAVVVFDRDSISGELTFREFLRNGQDGVENLSAPTDLIVADADQTVLVASSGADALVRFTRAADGQLAYASSLVQGELVEEGTESFVVDGLTGVRSLALSENGRWLYTYGRTAGDQAIGVFERESPTLVRPTRTLRNGDAVGVPPVAIGGLSDATQLVLTDNGQQLYLSGLDDAQALRSLAAFRIIEGADLQFLGRFDGSPLIDPPGGSHGLSVSSDGRHLYSTGTGFAAVDVWQLLGGSTCGRSGDVFVIDNLDLEAGGDVVYQVNSRVLANARGSVELNARIDPLLAREDADLGNNIDTVTLAIDVQADLEVTKTRQTDPIVAGEAVVWEIVLNNNGPSSLLGVDVMDSLPALPGDVANPMAPGVVSGSALWSCTGDDQLDVSQSFNEAEMAGARGVAFSPDGLWAAAVSQNGDALTLYQRSPGNGALVQADRLIDGDPIFDEDNVEIGTVSGLDGAFDVAFSPDQLHVVVVSADTDALAVFELDSDTGSLIFVQSLFDEPAEGETDEVFDLDEPVRLKFSPDGERVYIAARSSNAMTVFSRNAESGKLDWLESWGSGLAGLPVNAMDGVSDLVISPDGRFIYAAATANDGIGIFQRDDAGTITWVSTLVNGTAQVNGSVVGLGLVQALAISPKGRHLYAASLSEDSVTLFERDLANGSLTLQENYRDGVGGFQGLDGANGLLLSPDGESLIASARNDSNLVVFSRDWSDGRLRTLEIEDDSSLFDVRRMAMAPDGSSVLIGTGNNGGTFLNLRRQPEGYCGLTSSTADVLVDTVDIAANGSLRYQVEAQVHPGARGVLENAVDVTASDPGVLPASDNDSGPITVVTDVNIVKTIDGDASSLIGGGLVRFILDIGNDGPSHAFGVRLQDMLPPSIVSAEWSCRTLPVGTSQSVCPAAGMGDLDEIVDVVAGERLLVIINGQIASDFLGQISNTGTLTEPLDASDPDLGNNSSTVTATVSAVADVAIEKSVFPEEIIAGEAVVFTLQVDNFGPSDAPDVEVTDLLPVELIDPVWTCTENGGASCAATTGMGDLIETVSLPSGSSVVFEIEGTVDPFLTTPQVLSNVADVAVFGSLVNDPDLSNNQSTVDLVVAASDADLSVSKTVDLNAALPGTIVNYQIVVGNAGPSGSIEARLLDLMPVELINVSWTCAESGGASCPAATGMGDIDWTLTLPPASGLVIDVQAEIDPLVDAGPDRRLINVVTITPVSGADDSIPENNESSAVTVLDLDVIFRDRYQAPETVRTDEEPEG